MQATTGTLSRSDVTSDSDSDNVTRWRLKARQLRELAAFEKDPVNVACFLEMAVEWDKKADAAEDLGAGS